MRCNPENDEHTEECIKSNSEHCIEIFPSTIQMLNNELASYTWARLTWEQRLREHKTIYYLLNKNRTIYRFWTLRKTFPKITETLCQMQF